MNPQGYVNQFSGIFECITQIHLTLELGLQIDVKLHQETNSKHFVHKLFIACLPSESFSKFDSFLVVFHKISELPSESNIL